MIGTASNKAAIVHSQNIHTNCYCRNSLLVWCHQFNFFAHKMVGCSIWKMICTTAIRGSGALTPPHTNEPWELYICRYDDAKTGNIELIPISEKCGRITCMPGTTSPPTTPLLPTRPFTADAGCGGPAAKLMVVGLYEFSISSFTI